MVFGITHDHPLFRKAPYWNCGPLPVWWLSMVCRIRNQWRRYSHMSCNSAWKSLRSLLESVRSVGKDVPKTSKDYVPHLRWWFKIFQDDWYSSGSWKHQLPLTWLYYVILGNSWYFPGEVEDDLWGKRCCVANCVVLGDAGTIRNLFHLRGGGWNLLNHRLWLLCHEEFPGPWQMCPKLIKL